MIFWQSHLLGIILIGQLRTYRNLTDIFVSYVGVTLAERMLELYYDKWGRKVEPVFNEQRL